MFKIKLFNYLNIIFSIAASIIFCLQFDLSYKWFVINIIFAFYYLSIANFIVLFLSKFSSKVVLLITPIILIIYQFHFFIIHLSYYFGMIEFGTPFNLKIIYPYIKNYRTLVEADYMSIQMTYGIIIIILVILFFQLRFFWGINKSYSLIFNNFFVKKKGLKIFSSILLLLTPFVLINFVSTSNRVVAYKMNQPFLTFYYGSILGVEKNSDVEILLDKNHYPSNLNINKKNIIFIMCDALRSDYFGIVDKNISSSPFVDSLLNTKKYFKHNNFYSHTSSSYTGILNSFSSRTSVYKDNFFLYDVLKKYGYNVKFVLSGDFTNYWDLKKLIKNLNVDFYSDGYIQNSKDSKIHINSDKDNVINVLKSIKKFDGTPTFFYLHLMSTHQGSYVNKKTEEQEIEFNKKNIDAVKENYKNRVVQLDDFLKKTFKILKEKQFLDNSIVVITADHGQSLGDNDLLYHSKSTYISETQIPLIISVKEKSMRKIASQIDIAPTLINILKLPQPKTWEGTSIFNDSINKSIYQRQRNIYSIIWSEKKEIYQYVYYKKKSLFSLYNITKNNQNEILKKKFSLSKLDSLNKVLKEYFKL